MFGFKIIESEFCLEIFVKNQCALLDDIFIWQALVVHQVSSIPKTDSIGKKWHRLAESKHKSTNVRSSQCFGMGLSQKTRILLQNCSLPHQTSDCSDIGDCLGRNLKFRKYETCKNSQMITLLPC